MAVAHELVATPGADAEQHLELVLRRREAASADLRERVRDQQLVVRGDPDVAALVEQRAERRPEALADLLGVVVRDLERLDIDPLADADVLEAVRIREGPA